MSHKDLKFNSRAIHGVQKPDEAYGSVNTPIYQTSTFAQSAPGEHKGYEYSRTGNPTRKALEDSIAAIESGKFGLGFGSGLAAVDCILKLLKPGDEVISTSDLYGGSYRIFTEIFQPFGIKFHFVPMGTTDAVKAQVNKKTKLIWVETPTNPILSIIDIKAIAAVAKGAGALLAVDNTFASPYLQQPLNLGADIVMHSATKYLGGHSDVVMGLLVANNPELAKRLYFIQKSTGGVCGPMDSFLVLRGMKTLAVRMQRHCENGREIAHFLRNHPKVDKVYWPGFEDHPNHNIAKEQMNDFGGMVSFTLASGRFEDTVKVVSSFALIALADSLGGVESLAGHPASMSHSSVPKEDREKSGIVDSLIRLSVGIEDVMDIKADLNQALSKT